MQNMSNKWLPEPRYNEIKVTKNWLIGFIDGEGSFSYNKYVPRFRLENHYKELELYNKIKEFIGVGNTLIASRVNRVNSNPTIVLEINQIKILREIIIPLMQDNNHNVLLKSLKSKDFSLWIILINIYYLGYHTSTEGKYLFDAIKLHLNKYRLTTNSYLLENVNRISIVEIESLLCKLYLLDSPYEIKDSLRYYRNTNKLVSESASIVVLDSNNNKTIYNSLC
jgi:hypothetical protein